VVQNLKHTLWITVLCSLMGCATTIDYMVVGTGTHDGNKVHAGIIEFDHKWTAMGGIMTCCWASATGTQSIYDMPPPTSVYVKWYDYDPGIYYEATVPLSEDFYDIATDLPSFFWLDPLEEETEIDPHLIIGFGETGEVVVWISNAGRDGNKTGRVLHEVGRAQAKVVEKDTPRS